MKDTRKFLFFAVLLVFLMGFANTASAVTVQRLIIPYSVIVSGWWSGLALHNESDEQETYSVTFYDENGELVGGRCVTLDAHASEIDLLQKFADKGEVTTGSFAVYIRTAGESTNRFSATLFVTNTGEANGFGVQTYQSEEYEAVGTVLCNFIPPFMEPL